MNPEEIKLESIDKLFEYEKQVRMIDELDLNDLKEFTILLHI